MTGLLLMYFIGFIVGFFMGGVVYRDDINKWATRRRKWKEFVDNLGPDNR